jgi:hypothetical protein
VATEHRHRVDVLTVDPDREVEPGTLVGDPGTGDEPALGHAGAGTDQDRLEIRVAGLETAAVIHRHGAVAGHFADEAHHPVAGGAYRAPLRDLEVDSPVSGVAPLRGETGAYRPRHRAGEPDAQLLLRCRRHGET